MTEKKGQHIDLDLEDVKPKKGTSGPSAKTLLYTLSVLLFLGIITVAVGLVAQAITFKPFIIYDYKVDKTEYCPLEQVYLEQELEVQDKWYYSLGNLDGNAFMAMGGKPYLDSDVNVPLKAMPRDVYPSNAIRAAPPIPGVWKASGTGIVHGRMFGIIPVEQDLGIIESEEYTVLPWDSEQCLSTVLPNLDYEQSGE